MNKLVAMLQKLQWSIRYKIVSSFAVILVCFIVNAITSIFLLFHIQNTQAELFDASLFLEQLQRYQLAYTSELNLFTSSIFDTHTTLIRDDFRNMIAGDLGANPYSGKNETYRNMQQEFATNYLAVYDYFLKMGSQLGSSDFNGAADIWRQHQPEFSGLTNLLYNSKEKVKADRTQNQQAVNDAVLYSIIAIVASNCISILLAIFLQGLVQRVIVAPLNKLQQALDKVGEGDLAVEVKINNRDEIGKLATSFRHAVASLQQVIRGATIGESLSAVTTQLSVISKQQAAGTAEQASALTQIMASMQELGRTAGQIAENAVQVAELTRATLEQIDEVSNAGNTSQEQALRTVTVIEETLHGIARVEQQVNDFSSLMVELNQQSEEIGNIVSAIGSISDEVHLLALNAAIEASGAGQYGERFKVVAQQIKQLAGKTNRATQEARALVSKVQDSNRLALERVEEGQNEVRVVAEANSRMQNSLHDLESASRRVQHAVTSLQTLAAQVGAQTEEIKVATAQQQLSSEQVVLSTRSAGQVAEQTASATGQIATSSDQLAALTTQLNLVLNQIKLGI